MNARHRRVQRQEFENLRRLEREEGLKRRVKEVRTSTLGMMEVRDQAVPAA